MCHDCFKRMTVRHRIAFCVLHKCTKDEDARSRTHGWRRGLEQEINEAQLTWGAITIAQDRAIETMEATRWWSVLHYRRNKGISKVAKSSKCTILTYLLNGNLTEIAYPTLQCYTRHEAAITASTTTTVRSYRVRLGTSRCIARPHTSPAGYLASMAPEFRFQSGVYPALHIRGEGVSKNQGVVHGYTRDSLTYILECCCVYLVHHKFDLCIFPTKVDKTVCLC